MKRALSLILLLVVLTVAAAFFYARNEWRVPYPESSRNLVIDVPRGLRARGVAGFLEDRGVIRNRYLALAYILYSRNRNRLQAGEYLFDRPMTIPEVVDRLVRGDVYLHKFTVPEGLTVPEPAQKWQEQGFGPAEDFLKAAEGAVDFVHRFEPAAKSLEGYLFPETY